MLLKESLVSVLLIVLTKAVTYPGEELHLCFPFPDEEAKHKLWVLLLGFQCRQQHPLEILSQGFMFSIS